MNNFEWIIVDDGSTDKTKNLLISWQNESKFPIIWCRYTNNRGRNAAVNCGMQFISGKYNFVLDSDDMLLDDAIETINHWIEKTGFERLETSYALFFRCVDQYGSIVGEFPQKILNLFSGNCLKLSKKDGRWRFGLGIEVLAVLKTRMSKEFKFPELTDREHCPEAITWNRFCDIYDSIFINQPVRKYYRFEGDCLSDGASSGTKWPRGNYLWALSVLNEDIEYFHENRKSYFNHARKITRLGLHIGRPLDQQYKDLKNRTARLLWMLVIWRGLLGYFRDRLYSIDLPSAHSDISKWGPSDPPENFELQSGAKPLS